MLRTFVQSAQKFLFFIIVQIAQKVINKLKTFVQFDGARAKGSAPSNCTKILANFLHSSFCTKFFQHFFPILCKMTTLCKSQDGKLHKTAAASLSILPIDIKNQLSFCTNFILTI